MRGKCAVRRRHLLLSGLASALAARPVAGIAAAPAVAVYASPRCGCCGAWVDHLRAAGFAVDVTHVDDIAPVKRMAGVPAGLASCHTASVAGYVVEGHVPAHVVRRLLRERPEVRGIAVPGMPIGSPGMEGPSPEAYTVYAFAAAGEARPYERIRP